jgi:hypothetical protein
VGKVIVSEVRSVCLGLPPMLNARSGSMVALWNTVAGGPRTAATPGGSGSGTYGSSQGADKLFDSKLTTVFLSRGTTTGASDTVAGVKTGFYVTVAQCQPVLMGFIFGNANGYSNSEPLTVTVEGTNCADLTTCTSWTLLYSGSTGLDMVTSSSAYGYYQSFVNSVSYASYRFLITSKRGASTEVAYSEVQLFGNTSQTATSPNSASACKRVLMRESVGRIYFVSV